MQRSFNRSRLRLPGYWMRALTVSTVLMAPALTWQSAGLTQCSMDYKDFCLTCLVTLAAINTVINLRSQRRH